MMGILKKRAYVGFGISALLALAALGTLAVASADDGAKEAPPSGTVAKADSPSLQPEMKVGIHQVLDATGIRPEVFKQGFGEGKSVSQILTEQGFDPVAVSAAAVAESARQIDLAVAEGRIAAAESSSAKAAVAGQIARLIGA